jgi:virulence-associated protein VapD
MFAVAFDLVVAETRQYHPRGVSKAYQDIASLLSQYGFAWAQGSVSISENEDLANLSFAMNALKALPWFSKVVRDIPAFRVEQWSDFTAFMKDSKCAGS